MAGALCWSGLLALVALVLLAALTGLLILLTRLLLLATLLAALAGLLVLLAALVRVLIAHVRFLIMVPLTGNIRRAKLFRATRSRSVFIAMAFDVARSCAQRRRIAP